MALPSTGYGTATIDNPAGALTDFTLMIDLSRMHASWWSAVDTSDGTKGRAAKSDDTELATDWIDFDNSGETGWLRVKWSGTLAASGTQTIKIFPPVAANSSNAASATYGSDNAYDANWAAYWPMEEASGSVIDRTANGNDSSGGTSPTYGATGQVGSGLDFEHGSNEYLAVPDDSSLQITGNITLLAWINPESVGNIYRIFGAHYPSSPWNGYAFGVDSESRLRVWNGTKWVNSTGTVSTGSIQHVAASNDNSSTSLYFGGSLDVAPSQGNPNSFTGSQRSIGSRSDGGAEYFDGIIDDLQIHSTDRSSDWIAEEYDQTDSQSTFWGTWGWTAGGGGTVLSIPIAMRHYATIRGA